MKLAELEWITPNAEAQIVRCARVSTSMSEDNPERLLRYLIKNKHWSPFEMANACFLVHGTRDILRQILRHKSCAFQEFSQRYEEPEFTPKLMPFRVDAEQNHQSSVVCVPANPTEDHVLQGAIREWQDIQEEAKNLYARARAITFNGKPLAKELARKVCPEGLTMSRMFIAGPIRSWIHYLQARTDHHTQDEHREIAVEIAFIMHQQMPNTMKAIGLM